MYWYLLHNTSTTEVYSNRTARVAQSPTNGDRASVNQLCSLRKRMDKKGMTMVLQEPERRRLWEAMTARGWDRERTHTRTASGAGTRGRRMRAPARASTASVARDEDGDQDDERDVGDERDG